jgi:host factor-I protein
MAQNHQDALLNAVRRDNIPVTVYLTSGFQIRGQLRGFDNFVLFVESDGKQQMVYKHAISTVVPVKPINHLFNGAAEG